MNNSIKEQTLKQLRALKADFDARQKSKNACDLLEKQIILADREYDRVADKIKDEYSNITRKKANQFDPEKEAAKTTPMLSVRETRKKCLPHALIVSAICLVWLIASFVIMKQQLLPDLAKVNITVMMVPRVLYAIGVIGILYMYISGADRNLLTGGCLFYSIPGVFAVILSISNYDLFDNVTLLRILDITLGFGSWILAFFAPSPNRAHFKKVEALQAKKKEMMEHIEEEAKAAEEAAPPAPPAPSAEEVLLTEIRDLLKAQK